MSENIASNESLMAALINEYSGRAAVKKLISTASIVEVDSRACVVAAQLDNDYLEATLQLARETNALNSFALATVRYLQGCFRLPNGMSLFDADDSMGETRSGEYRTFFKKGKEFGFNTLTILAIADKQKTRHFYRAYGLGKNLKIN